MLPINDITSLKEQILNVISILDITVANEYNRSGTGSLQTKPLVCVYLKSISINQSMLNDYLYSEQCDNNLNDVYGKKAKIRLGMSIYSKNANCDEIFTQVASLILVNNVVSANSINCLSMEYNSIKKVYELQAELEFEKIITLPLTNNLEENIC